MKSISNHLAPKQEFNKWGLLILFFNNDFSVCVKICKKRENVLFESFWGKKLQRPG